MSTYNCRLRRALVDADAPTNPGRSVTPGRITSPVAVVAGALAAVAIAAIATFVPSRTAAAGVTVTPRPDTITIDIDIDGIVADPAAAEAAIAAAGVDVDIVEVPVPDRYAGEVLWPDVRVADGIEIDGTAWTVDRIVVPADHAGTLELHLGRPARPGEPWHIHPDVLNGGRLSCTGVAGSTRAEATAIIARHFERVSWKPWLGAAPGETVDDTWIVLSAHATADDAVTVGLGPDNAQNRRIAAAIAESSPCGTR